MATSKPKRTPVKKASGSAKKTGKAKKKAKVRRDPLKEYQEFIRGRGVAEVLALSDDDSIAHVKTSVSTQSVALDHLLNRKGIPCGRLTEIYGPPHVGKSTLLDHLFAQVQKMGGVGVLADTEVSRDMSYCKAIGVDVDALQYVKFKEEIPTVEGVLSTVMDTVRFWKNESPETPVVIGWDAFGGTSTQDEVDKFEKDKSTKPGAAAKVMAMAKRQLIPVLGGSNVAFVVLNHTYEKINTGGRVGTKRETYGGRAIRHAASIRLEMHFTSDGWVKASNGVVRGRIVGVKLVKNRLGNPHGTAEFCLLSGYGVDNTWSIYRELTARGLIEKNGSWNAFNIDGEVYNTQGYPAFETLMWERPDIFQKLAAVYASLEN